LTSRRPFPVQIGSDQGREVLGFIPEGRRLVRWQPFLPSGRRRRIVQGELIAGELEDRMGIEGRIRLDERLGGFVEIVDFVPALVALLPSVR
jgi:hypothetical protein